MEQTHETKHTCPTGHCCDCDGCGTMCMRSGTTKQYYWLKHMIVLVLGVIAAFFVGMKLGEIKGYIHGSYGMTPMRNRAPMLYENNVQELPLVEVQQQ